MKPLFKIPIVFIAIAGSILVSGCSSTPTTTTTSVGVGYSVYGGYGYPYGPGYPYPYYPGRPINPERPDRPERPDGPSIQPVPLPSSSMGRPSSMGVTRPARMPMMRRR